MNTEKATDSGTLTTRCDTDNELLTLVAERLSGISDEQLKELKLYRDCTSTELVKQVLGTVDGYSEFQQKISACLRKGICTLEDMQQDSRYASIADKIAVCTDALKKRVESPTNGDTVERRQMYMLSRMERYNASVGNLNVSDGYSCSLCNNRGNYMRLRDGVFEIYDRCKCMKVRESIQRLWQSGLENSIKRLTFDAYKAETDWQIKAKETAQKYAKESSTGDWFYIGGAVGSGKTHLCTAICRELLLRGESVKYMMWTTESAALKAMITDDEQYGRRIREFKTVDALYIDDFFKPTGLDNAPRPADIRLAYEIINERYISGKRTIISSEWLNSKLLEFDEATGSRIYEKSKKYCVNIAYTDRNRNYRLRE